jgi:hypothetical protein
MIKKLGHLPGDSITGLELTSASASAALLIVLAVCFKPVALPVPDGLPLGMAAVTTFHH